MGVRAQMGRKAAAAHIPAGRPLQATTTIVNTLRRRANARLPAPLSGRHYLGDRD